MQLFQIYEWIENHYLYYKQNPGTHWKVNLREHTGLFVRQPTRKQYLYRVTGGLYEKVNIREQTGLFGLSELSVKFRIR